jgi:TetR/AcrR family transcriptional regulator
MNQRAISPAAPGTTSDAGATTPDDLIAAGRSLFAKRGYDGASVRAITRQAGANLGSVTYHFGSKRGLYAAVLEQGLRPLAERVRDAAQSEGRAIDRMIRVVEAYFVHFERNPDVPYLLLQEVTAGKQPPAVVLEIIAEVKSTLARLHAEGVRDGSVQPGHPVLTALSVVSQPIYLTLIAPLAKTVADLDLSEPETRRTAVEHVTAFVRAGLEPRGEHR